MNKKNKIVWIAALIQFVNIVDFMMIMPLGADLAANLPVTNADIGIVCGCYTLAIGISSIICAKFIDAYTNSLNPLIIGVIFRDNAILNLTQHNGLNPLIIGVIFRGYPLKFIFKFNHLVTQF